MKVSSDIAPLLASVWPKGGAASHIHTRKTIELQNNFCQKKKEFQTEVKQTIGANQ